MRIASTPRTVSRRGGFTLVEMFVVIAIIAVLVALTASAVLYLMGWGPSTASKATLRKADSIVRQQWTPVEDEAANEWAAGRAPGQVLQAADGYPDRAKKLWIFLRLHQEFPTSFQEVYNGYSYTAPNGTQIGMPSKAYYQNAIKGVPSDAQAGAPARESAALLLLAMSQSRRGQNGQVEDALGTSAIQNIHGISAIVDGWGTPVQFQLTLNDPMQNPNPPAGSNTPVITSAGPNLKFGDGDDLNSVDLRQTTTGGN